MSTDLVLGEGYTAQHIALAPDAEGPVHATLVHRLERETDAPPPPGGRRIPILIGHGWSDYVFDRDLQEHLGGQGFDIWSLDLRKYGRSLLPGQTPTAIDHLNRYDEEIGASLRVIAAGEPDNPPVLLSHSLGGLIATLYAQRHPGAVRALALNSPWLEMHLGPAVRHLASGPVRTVAERLADQPILPRGSEHYARTTHRDYGGQYDYDLALKPPGGHRFPASTLAAVLDGQRRASEAGPLAIPVLVLHSRRTRIGAVFTEEMRRADTVLDVHAMAWAAKQLGPEVRIAEIDGARHDVFLSDPDAREAALEILDDWLTSFSS